MSFQGRRELFLGGADITLHKKEEKAQQRANKHAKYLAQKSETKTFTSVELSDSSDEEQDDLDVYTPSQ